MIAGEYSEAEIQALITLGELQDPIDTPNNNSYVFYPSSAEEARRYFRGLAVDTFAAHESLAMGGLVERAGAEWTLTPAGISAAREIRQERPPIYYWYREYYGAVARSRVYAEYCEQVYGRNLSQHGFADQGQLELALRLLRLDERSRLLDLGCGNGALAAYIAERTGALVTGLDYCPEAIAHASRRAATAGHGRLEFVLGDMAHLEFAPGSFTHFLAVDSIFFGPELSDTIRRAKELLAPGGQMAILCGDDLIPVLETHGLAFAVHGLAREHHRVLLRRREVALEMEDAFEADGIRFIWVNQMAESKPAAAEFDPQTRTCAGFCFTHERAKL